jgi:uncharacterized protein (TIGR02996 family)
MSSHYDNPDYWALIRKIREIDRAGGDSTLVRLVTADWLQDHGEEERAMYIRWRCEDPTPFSHVPGDGAGSLVLLDPEGTPVAVELVEKHRGVQFYSAGGWVVGVRCPFTWWLTCGLGLCRRNPIREVAITDRWAAEHMEDGFFPARNPPHRPFWYRGVSAVESHWIHPDVFDRMEFDSGLQPPPATTGYFAGVPRSDSVKYYPDEAAAASALNAGALLWAESEADTSTEATR